MGMVQSALEENHVRLATLLDRLGKAADGGDWATVQRAWDELEVGMLAHMDAEERHLFPALETSHPDEIGRIRREHASFRRELAETGLRTQLHSLRREQVERLCDELREHAAREDRTLYRWADEIVPEHTRRTLLAYLAAETTRRLEGRRRESVSHAPPPR